ncbi:hypothetical protein SNOG_09683 [Parastagonospora nodorum SN15]|uniref:Uncharacterized protein n=1 Tax=Phaeosphaeria nodorum (strain SN15 / ATCC MYA-4574 / FGSC 10173) TaxID=321614 RepID=Q0UEY1_PHANO|nr:hypothetical protein SNOG_09683 [Parastagonospora nodorum SN15]EAT82948.1 hypothetical protein SNOG_09683 [Parastagonospora nodorum SN15]
MGPSAPPAQKKRVTDPDPSPATRPVAHSRPPHLSRPSSALPKRRVGQKPEHVFASAGTPRAMFAATARPFSPSPTGTIVTFSNPGSLSPAPSLSIAGSLSPYLRGLDFRIASGY